MNTEMTTRETELTAQVAALELEVAKLRSVMADVIKSHGYAGGTPVEALSTPFAPTTLPELIEKVERRTIERCAVVCEGIYTNGDGAEGWLEIAAAAIRKLGEQ